MGSDGILTVPMLNAWEFLSLDFKDTLGTIRQLSPSITGSLVYGTSALATINDLTNYQQNLTAGTGIEITGTTIKSYDLKWNTNTTPTAPIRCIVFNDFGISENLNLTSGQVELIVTSPVSANALNSKQDVIQDFSQTTPTVT